MLSSLFHTFHCTFISLPYLPLYIHVSSIPSTVHSSLFHTFHQCFPLFLSTKNYFLGIDSYPPRK
jgi:hypothetical protein